MLVASGKRSRFEVYCDVLRAVRKGIDKPTRIMYAANLSWNTLEDALAKLQRIKLINVQYSGDTENSPRRYVLTERGSDVCNLVEQVFGAFNVLENTKDGHFDSRVKKDAN